MKTLHVELSDDLAREVVRASLREFISHRRFELMEQQQLEDVAWSSASKPLTGFPAGN